MASEPNKPLHIYHRHHHHHHHNITDDEGGESDGAWWVKEVLQGQATQHPADCGSPVTPPTWLHRDKLKRGQAFFHKNFLSVFVSNLVGLLCLLTVPSILRVLRSTGHSTTIRAAYKRYLGTLTHLQCWYSGDIFDPQSSAFKSIQLVRKFHCNAFRASPATQADMVITQWAFLGLVMTRAEHLGIVMTQPQKEGLVHFWRAVGYLLGVEDRFNLCGGNVEEVRDRCEMIQREIMAQGVLEPPPHFHTMAEALLEGVHRITPVMNPAALAAFTHSLLDVPYSATLPQYSACMFTIMTYNFQYALHVPVVGVLLRIIENNLLHFNIHVCKSWPMVVTFFNYLEQAIMTLINIFVTLYRKAISASLLVFKRNRNNLLYAQ